MSFRSRAVSTNKGFTLVELLTVIAIIGIMALGIGKALESPAESQGLKSAQSTLATMMQTARNIASMKGRPSRLIINMNTKEPQNCLRQIGIVYSADSGRDLNDLEDDLWAPAGPGAHLPEKTYYIPNDGPEISGQAQGDMEYSDAIGPDGGGYAADFEFPMRRGAEMPTVSSASGADWAYYEFLPNGLVAKGSANKKVILYSGVLVPTPTNEVDHIKIDNGDAIGGFLLTMLGGIVPFPDRQSAENLQQ